MIVGSYTLACAGKQHQYVESGYVIRGLEQTAEDI